MHGNMKLIYLKLVCVYMFFKSVLKDIGRTSLNITFIWNAAAIMYYSIWKAILSKRRPLCASYEEMYVGKSISKLQIQVATHVF